MSFRLRLSIAGAIAVSAAAFGSLVVVSGAAILTHGETSSAGRIYFLEISHGGRVMSARPDGSGLEVISIGRAAGPDGIAVLMNPPGDGPPSGRLYWTTMGRASENDGTIESADVSGLDPRTVVPAGGTFTPKQIKIDGAKIYWADREGMRIMRANRDGTNIETLVETGHGDADRRDARNWCVGIALDSRRGEIYWTQKGSGGNGRIRRAPIAIPAGQTAATRTDIETLFDNLPEPIDMDLDLATRTMYWTDRGDPPRGNTVNRAPMDQPANSKADPQILFGGLHEGIGIALDRDHARMFVTDLGGNVYGASLDGSTHATILTGQGTLTGIAYTAVDALQPFR
jgi:hypothetical protein